MVRASLISKSAEATSAAASAAVGVAKSKPTLEWREQIGSFLLGGVTAASGYWYVKRYVIETREATRKELDAMKYVVAGKESPKESATVPTFAFKPQYAVPTEVMMKRKFIHLWNSGLDLLYVQLVHLPDYLNQAYDQVASKAHSLSASEKAADIKKAAE